jgi:hypothetical protein
VTTPSSNSLKRVARTFVIAFLGIFLPGALGFLHGLTEWASSQGQTPFPDMHSLAYVAVAAIVAGCIALVNLIVVWFEDATGKGLLRNVAPASSPTSRPRSKHSTASSSARPATDVLTSRSAGSSPTTSAPSAAPPPVSRPSSSPS